MRAASVVYLLPGHWGSQRVVGTAGLPRSPLQGWHTHPPAAMSSGSKQPPSQESCPWLRRATLPGRLGPPLFPLAAPSHQPLANWDSLQKPAFVDWSKARLQGDHTAAQQRPSASPFWILMPLHVPPESALWVNPLHQNHLRPCPLPWGTPGEQDSGWNGIRDGLGVQKGPGQSYSLQGGGWQERGRYGEAGPGNGRQLCHRQGS